MKPFIFRALVLSLGCVTVAAAPTTPASAQTWRPSAPVTLLVPSNPGGGHDSNARALVDVMRKHAGQSIVVVNKDAGGGVVAFTEMKEAKPDGLTIGQASTSLVTDKFRLEGITYSEKTYTFIGQIAADYNLLVVASKGPYGSMSLKEFLAAAKAQPGRIRIGVSGNWGNQDYVRYAIEKAGGVSFRRIPIKGGRAVMLGILSGDLHAGLLYPSEVKAQVDAGELKILGYNGSEPLKDFPAAQSFTAQGLDVGLPIWRALLLPLGTPADIVAGWRDILRKTMQDPEINVAYAKFSVIPVYKDGPEALAVIEKNRDELYAISREAGLIK